MLIENRDPNSFATAFQSRKNFPEPLLTIWESKSYKKIQQSFEVDNYSLRDILQRSDCKILKTPDDKILLNINKPDEFEAIQKALNLPPEKL